MITSESKRELSEIANEIRATGLENWLFNRLVDKLAAYVDSLILAAYEQGKGERK